MEDVLDLYAQPYDAKKPVVCMDETNKQLISEFREPIPIRPGQPTRYDYQYRREGVCNLFMFFEPLKGWREVIIKERRTKKEWVLCLKQLLETHYKEAEVVRIVLDNLNTHDPAAFYELFDPAEAKCLLDRLEFHNTPKHASWLNMVEIEFSVLTRQCLRQRISSLQHLQTEVATGAHERNKRCRTVDWHFTTVDARVKLKRLYPSYLE